MGQHMPHGPPLPQLPKRPGWSQWDLKGPMACQNNGPYCVQGIPEKETWVWEVVRNTRPEERQEREVIRDVTGLEGRMFDTPDSAMDEADTLAGKR